MSSPSAPPLVHGVSSLRSVHPRVTTDCLPLTLLFIFMTNLRGVRGWSGVEWGISARVSKVHFMILHFSSPDLSDHSTGVTSYDTQSLESNPQPSGLKSFNLLTSKMTGVKSTPSETSEEKKLKIKEVYLKNREANVEINCSK